MRNENIKIGNMLANRFNKKLGIITYSGTLAIELALLDCNLPEGSGVIVSNEVCSSVINTIIKLNLKPILIQPKKDFIITSDEIEKTLKKYQISCILLVHQYGLFNDISSIKQKYPYIKIIEDIAQLWVIDYFKNEIGRYSDYIVTSFGKTKPLSYGIGGAVITNNTDILSKIDFCDNISRNSNQLLYSYAYSLCDTLNINSLILKANKIVTRQKEVANLYNRLFEGNQYIHIVKNADINTWHRFPIWIKEKKYFDYLIKLLDECDIEYQLPHENKTNELPLIKEKSVFIQNSLLKENVILLRTRISNINKFKNKLIKLKLLLDN